LGDVLGRVTMQVFVRDHHTMIAAPVQGDVDGVAKGSHYFGRPLLYFQRPVSGHSEWPFSAF
jgi:hypothetical protein